MPGRYTYDAGDHLRTVSRPGRGTISFSYDAIGRLRSASSPSVDARLTYEANTGLLSTAATGSGATGQSFTLSYDGTLPWIELRVARAGVDDEH